MRRPATVFLFSSFLFVGLGTPLSVWGETRVQVGIEAPQYGATISGPSRVTVRGQARASRDYRPALFDLMLILDTSGSTRAPAGVQSVGGFGDTTILAAEVRAAERLLETLDPKSTRVGIVTFAGEYNRFTGSGMTNQANAILAQSLTANYQDVRLALHRILRRGPRGNRHGGRGPSGRAGAGRACGGHQFSPAREPEGGSPPDGRIPYFTLRPCQQYGPR